MRHDPATESTAESKNTEGQADTQSKTENEAASKLQAAWTARKHRNLCKKLLSTITALRLFQRIKDARSKIAIQKNHCCKRFTTAMIAARFMLRIKRAVIDQRKTAIQEILSNI